MQPNQPSLPENNTPQPNPQVMFQPSVQAYQPALVTAQLQQPPAVNGTVPAVQPVTGQSPAKKRSKLPFIVGGALVFVLIALTVVALTLGGKKATPKATTNTDTSATSNGPAAATSGTMQQNYDAVSQSLNSLDDNRDFPAAALDDTTLAKS